MAQLGLAHDPGHDPPNVPIEQLHHLRVLSWEIALLSTFMTCIVSAYSIFTHLNFYNYPDQQRRVIRIIFMVPLYAITSFFSLWFVGASVYLDLLRDSYEAFVLYQFFMLMMGYLGGEFRVEGLLKNKSATPHLWPLYHCLKPVQVSHPTFLIRIKQLVFQFFFIKPVLAILSIVFAACGILSEGHWDPTSAYPYVTFIDNLSISLCFYALVLFYTALRDDLKAYHPVPKFLCVKSVIFFSFWQSVAVSALVMTDIIRDAGSYLTAQNIATGFQDFLICLEMFIFSLVHLYAFNHREWMKYEPERHYSMEEAFMDCLSLKDVVKESRHTLSNRGGYRRLLEVPADDLDSTGRSQHPYYATYG
eukprot:Clim_evm67s25 gene=Clim_evmTU67s25